MKKILIWIFLSWVACFPDSVYSFPVKIQPFSTRPIATTPRRSTTTNYLDSYLPAHVSRNSHINGRTSSLFFGSVDTTDILSSVDKTGSSSPITSEKRIVRGVSYPRRFMLSLTNNSEDEKEEDVRMDGIPSTPFDRPVLAAIDALMIMIFASIGKASHSGVDGSLDVLAVTKTALPFLFSWFLVTPLLGCFTPMATGEIKEAVLTTSKGWIVAIPLGCVIRGIVKGYIPPVPFVIVTMIATLVLLAMGRAIYTAAAEVVVELL